MQRVLIVTDIRLYREGLAQMLAREVPLDVVGTASDGSGALSGIQTLEPDIVLLDMAMPEGLAIARAIAEAAPAVKVVALAVREVEDDVVACAEAGAAGYVPRSGSREDLVAMLESVGRGEALCSPRMAAGLLRRLAQTAGAHRDAADGHHLTAREGEVLRLIDRGCSNKDIARCLGIEVATVKNHVHNILGKLRVHRRGEAAARVRPDHQAEA
jgi:DNA-binding NarL/FixJ family response regulator